MKRKIILIGIVFSIFFSGFAVATSINGNFEGSAIVKLFANGKEVIASDVPAINYKNRTMVPIYLLNQLGIETKWEASNYSVSITMPTTIKIVHPALTQEKLNEIAKSVYEVFGSTDDPTKASQGSSFIIGHTLITNYHVSGASEYIQVQIDNQWQKISQQAFSNKTNDLVGYSVSGGTSLPYSTELPEKDAIVYSIGYPAGKLTITEGTVLSVIQIDGITNIVSSTITDHGSSGGCLLNDKGEIIGITTSGPYGSTITDSIPISYALQELNKLQK